MTSWRNFTKQEVDDLLEKYPDMCVGCMSYPCQCGDPNEYVNSGEY